MNIKQAKDYISKAVRLYLKKDEFGEYQISVVRQRPIFLLGAPGIGKTAIMEQIAQELGIALVSYSMTHHTRQSALGLPFITKKQYDGKEFTVSEYTMSEIIASIYDTMEGSGLKEGILFLDEINCVSETLAPSMLQFLQYKIFGRHQVPEGWVIVTAGNPPEYNKSVHEFDVVTLDRLKVLEVEAEYSVWKEYALERRVHGSILSYLDLKKEHFYVCEMTTAGKSYVTARGWEDLSEMLYLYESENMEVEDQLISQYLRNERVVKEFSAYYDLYNKYKRDYQIEELLKGSHIEKAALKAKTARFDERVSVIGMLLDALLFDMGNAMEQVDMLTELRGPLKALQERADKEASESDLLEVMELQLAGRKKRLESLQIAGSLSSEEKRRNKRMIQFYEDLLKGFHSGALQGGSGQAVFAEIKKKYEARVLELKSETEAVKKSLEAIFTFIEKAFCGEGQDGNEMLIFITELTIGKQSARFLATFGSEAYNRYNKEMMLSQRTDELSAKISEWSFN